MCRHRPKLLAIMLTLPLAGCETPTVAVPPVGDLEAAPPVPSIPEPDAAAAWTPPGYRAEVVVKDLIYPSSVEFDDRGTMYVAESGFVYGDAAAPARVLRILQDGRIDVAAVGLNGPVTDLLWHDGRLYISHRGKISALGADGRLEDLVTGLPSQGDHHNNQMSVGPDGRIYFGQGTATNSGVVGIDNFMMGWLQLHPDFHDRPAETIRLRSEDFTTINPFMLTSTEPFMLTTTSGFAPFSENQEVIQGTTKANGTILRMNPDGSGLEAHAWGLRNPYGVAWGPDGRLYVAENGFDARGSRPIANAPDTLWTVREGRWYGWPDYASGVPVTDPRFKPGFADQPEFIMAEHPPVEEPLLTVPEHAGITQIEFSPGGGFGFDGELFMAEFGDMAPMTGRLDVPHGRQVIRIDPASGEMQPFFHVREGAEGPQGMEHVATSGPKRPVDVRFSPDGNALYVVDIGAFTVVQAAAPKPIPFPGTGVVWRITRDGASTERPPADLSAAPGGA
jgi:glucose/arabinose dehydrogenase